MYEYVDFNAIYNTRAMQLRVAREVKMLVAFHSLTNFYQAALVLHLSTCSIGVRVLRPSSPCNTPVPF